MPDLMISPKNEKIPAAVSALASAVEADGGVPLAAYQEPIGDHWHIFAMLPIAKAEATPYQRDLSPAHLKRMLEAMKKINPSPHPISAFRPSPSSSPPNLHLTPPPPL